MTGVVEDIYIGGQLPDGARLGGARIQDITEPASAVVEGGSIRPRDEIVVL